MRGAFLGAVALVIVACSGAAPTILDESKDGGMSGSGSSGSGSGSSSGGGSGGSSGGSSSGQDAMLMGDDQSDATTLPPQDAATLDVHEAAACMPSPPAASGACNSITAPASSVTVTCNATEAVPAPVGGVIHDGTYKLISATYYAGGATCPTPETDGVVWDICGPSWQISQNDTVNGAPQPALIANATVVATGSTVAITLTCGLTSQPITFGYDADPNSLRLHIGGGTTATSGRVDTFARQ